MSDTIKSRPVYRPLAFDPSGLRHLLLCDQAAPPEAALAPNFPLERAEVWVVNAASPAGPAEHDAGPHNFRAIAALLVALRARLARERMGLRLYAVGTEGFLWDVAAIARDTGVGADEIGLNHAGSARRRVQCVHCKTLAGDVVTNIVICPGCGTALLVRDHFSRRLGAFMGVQVDAEAPGEIPEMVECYE